jgi:hypothetical protein
LPCPGQDGCAEHRQCRRFGDPVAGLGGGAPGMTVHSGGVGEVADIQVTEDGGGQAYGVASSSVVGGMRGDRDRVDRCASSHASAAVGLCPAA